MLLVQFPDSIALASPISNNQIVNSWTNADLRFRVAIAIVDTFYLIWFYYASLPSMTTSFIWCRSDASENDQWILLFQRSRQTNDAFWIENYSIYTKSTVCIDTIRWLVPGGGRYQCTQWLPTLHSILRSVYLLFVFRMYGKHLYVIRSNALFHVDFTFGHSGARSTISFIRTNFPGTLTRWFTFIIRSFRETNGKTVFHRSIDYRLLAIENHDILV